MPRDVKRGFAAWKAAADRAPDDGSEEAAFAIFDEQQLLTPKQRSTIQPDRYLRLAASLGYMPAVEALAARQSADPLAQMQATPKKERFTRETLNKARAWTARELRGEAMIE